MLSETTNWPRLYAAAALAGAVVGVLWVAGVLPGPLDATPGGGRRVGGGIVAVLAPVAGGTLLGLALAAVAQLGIRWQLGPEDA
jgi:hypothetical protein